MRPFTPEMIAPCGLDCSVCKHALDEENPCPGCRADEPGKYVFCAEKCPILHRCERPERRSFCFECDEFPCAWVRIRDDCYTHIRDYAMYESPIANLIMVRDEGMDRLLKHSRESFTCPKCGGVICVHDGLCRGCGASYHR